MQYHLKLFAAVAFGWFALATAQAAENGQVLWQIGQPDDNDSELAISNHDYAHWDWSQDVFYLVGSSDSHRDWPYAQPGPDDAWAGGKPHTFRVLFGLQQPPEPGNCALEVRLIDTHYASPPHLLISVNGTNYQQELPKGAGDASLEGHPEQGKHSRFTINFPTSLLHAGDNEISIKTTQGSWMVYDSVSLTTPSGTQSEPVTAKNILSGVETISALAERDGKFWQPVKVSIWHTGNPASAQVQLAGGPAVSVDLHAGVQSTEVLAPAVETETPSQLTVQVDGSQVAQQTVTLRPVRKWVVYLLMHSHNDIGYTDIQPHIEKKQAQNVIRALQLIHQTQNNPEGSRFKWNLEVLMPAEDFFKTATTEQKQEFMEAVRNGNIGLDAMYANLLTGLCRGEELVQELTFAKALGKSCGYNVDSMMISDVPGLTWGIVPALAQNGVRYISDGPNGGVGMDGDRIGYVRVAWENKPFYWQSESGQDKVLFWSALGGYSFGHHYATLPDALQVMFQRMEDDKYPYDIVQLRWSKGDNGPADEGAIRFVRDWNARYAYPKIIIATTSEAFHAFEQRYGSQLPTYSGDLTPYWDDGAGSGARETALNRHSVDQLLQAETLWAMLNPNLFPTNQFNAAWKNAVLWDEHTWGAWNSISEPDNPQVKEQWHYKQAYALQASAEAHQLLNESLSDHGAFVTNAVDVFNTASWPRTDLVTVPSGMNGDCVKDEKGHLVPSQRLSSGVLVFLAQDIPAFGGRRFFLSSGTPPAGKAQANDTLLSTPQLTLKLDEKTGAIISLHQKGIESDLADGSINNYLYLPGADVKDVQSNGPVKIIVKEAGPLVAELSVESPAPGCNRLLREIRLVDGLDRVIIGDLVDKKAVRDVEGVHFGFEFNVPDPVVHVNVPGAVEEIEKDQLPGACKNWYPVERWADVSDNHYGVTWSTADAPLLEIGGLTANLPRSQPDPNVYLKTIKPSSHFYSWAMNNHWETNYRADQEGPVWFHYAIHPHHAYNAAEAMRFGVESTEPLIAVPAAGELRPSLLQLQSKTVIATAFKPSNDSRGIIVRLFNASNKPASTQLKWTAEPKRISLSDASEQALRPTADLVEIPAWGLITLRADDQ